jgi:oxalate---CoA ligase
MSNWSDGVTIHDLLKLRAEQNGDAVAIVSPGRPPLTYQRLLHHIDQTAESLELNGITSHDRIGIVLPGGPELATAFLAVASTATAVPLNPAYRENEFDYFIEDLRPKALIVASTTDNAAVVAARKRGVDVISLRPCFEAAAGLFALDRSRSASTNGRYRPRGDDTALLLYTSGTTSRPKRVPLTHHNLLSSAENIAACLRLNPNDRCLNIMPLYHIHGLVGGLLSSLTATATVAVPLDFSGANFFAWLEDLRPTWYTAVPTMHHAIWRSAVAREAELRSHSLRFIRSSSSSLAPKLLLEMEAIFKVPVIEAYGMTEAAHQVATNPLPPLQRKVGSVGVPTRTEVAVLGEGNNLLGPGEIGEIVLRGANVTKGYDGNSEANQAAFIDGWFRTGDQGYLDTDGYLFLTGRIKELINRGGAKLSPLETEAVLLDHSAVSAAAVFSVRHGTLGEDVAAAVVVKPDHNVTQLELQQFVASRLADFKVPRQIAFVEEIPTGGTGKVQRNRLASQLGLDTLETETKHLSAEPRTDLEAKVASIWCAVLRLDRISVHDSFFSLGGDSLAAAEVTARLGRALGVELSLLSFIDTPTVAAMAGRVESLQPANDGSERRVTAKSFEASTFSSLVELQRGKRGSPIFLFPGGGGGDWEFFDFMTVVRHMRPDYTLYGFRARGATGFGEPHLSVDEMVTDYLVEMQRLQPEGPYFLIGDCIGGAVAVEAARRLQAKGQEIASLILLDAQRPTALKYCAYRLEALGSSIGNGIARRWKTIETKVRTRLQRTGSIRDLFVRGRAVVTVDTGSKSIEEFQEVIDPLSRTAAAQEIHRRNLRRYRSKRYNGEIKLVVNAKWFERNATLGWARLAGGGVESYAAPGHHLTYRVAGPHAETVAKQLMKWIDAAQGGDQEKAQHDSDDGRDESHELPLFWRELLTNTKAVLGKLVPAGERYILVDDYEWGGTFLEDRLALSFPEGVGLYDGETAVRDLVQLREAGANFIIFASPAFWWLSVYVELREFLQTRFDCILQNECVVAFDLRIDKSASAVDRMDVTAARSDRI